MKAIDFKELEKTISYRMGTFKCSRCGKEEHIPTPSLKELKSMGIFSWTAFMSHYIKYKAGWAILKTFRGEYICPNCKREDDVTDDRKVQIFDIWFEKYQEWVNKKL